MVAVVQSVKLLVEGITGVEHLVAYTRDADDDALLPYRIVGQNQLDGVDRIRCHIPGILEFGEVSAIDRDERFEFFGGCILGTHVGCECGSREPLGGELILEGDVACAVAVLIEAVDGADDHTLAVAHHRRASFLGIAQRAITDPYHATSGVALGIPCLIGRKGIADSGGIGIALVTAGIEDSDEILQLEVGHQLHVAVDGQFAFLLSIGILMVISPGEEFQNLGLIGSSDNLGASLIQAVVVVG